MLALVPGVSRSGATIVGGMLMRLDRAAAAEFSFFLAMPTMVAAFVYQLLEVRASLAPDRAAEIAIGFVAAFVAAALRGKAVPVFRQAVGFCAIRVVPHRVRDRASGGVSGGIASMQWLRRRLITGFFVTIPLVISVCALVWIFGIIDRFTAPLATRVLGREVPGLGILITLLVVLAVGALATNVIGRRILARGEEWLMRVPVFRTIYAPVKQLVAAFSPDNEYGFKRVVMVEDPHRGIVLGFLTKEFAVDRGRGGGVARGRIRADEPSVPRGCDRVSAEQRVLSRCHGRGRHPHISYGRDVDSRPHTRQGDRVCSADAVGAARCGPFRPVPIDECHQTRGVVS